jgi:hypothetical protein
MSLGWLNLQEYLGANAGVADDMATRVDDAAFSRPANSPAAMSYGEFLARRRTTQSESGRAALLGGDAGDAAIAGMGKSRAAQPTIVDPQAKARQDAANRQSESSYWAKQAERNKGLAAQSAADRQKQADSVTAARKAMEQRAGGPGYGAYSREVENSFNKSRGRQVRVIGQEEADRWTRR